MLTSRQWPKLLLGALALATVVGFFVYPTYTTYDSLYSLLWGRELLHGHLPDFQVYRAPTEHPVAIAFGAALSILGDPANRIMVFATLASYVALVAGIYRLAALAFTRFIGIVAAALLFTRFDFAYLAVRSYIDIPYLAIIVWAACFEAEAHAAGHFRHARGTLVLSMLAVASTMRPEAWLLAGLYWLWLAIDREQTWRYRIGTALLAATGPIIWVAVDKIVTGDALYSLHSTSLLAESLGRNKGLSSVPHATQAFLNSLDKWPVLVAGVIGLFVAAYVAPRRSSMPLILLVTGLGTFVMVGIAGLSIINRYLLVPSLMVMIFAAVTLGGWTMLEQGTAWRKWWARGAVLVVLGGAAFTVTHLSLKHFDADLSFRRAYHASLEDALHAPGVAQAIKDCGPVSVPNHKLIPDVRWITDLGPTQVIARSDPAQAKRILHGVAIYPVTRFAVYAQAFVTGADLTSAQIPMAGFHRIATSRYYGVYASCG